MSAADFFDFEKNAALAVGGWGVVLAACLGLPLWGVPVIFMVLSVVGVVRESRS